VCKARCSCAQACTCCSAAAAAGLCAQQRCAHGAHGAPQHVIVECFGRSTPGQGFHSKSAVKNRDSASLRVRGSCSSCWPSFPALLWLTVRTGTALSVCNGARPRPSFPRSSGRRGNYQLQLLARGITRPETAGPVVCAPGSLGPGAPARAVPDQAQLHCGSQLPTYVKQHSTMRWLLPVLIGAAILLYASVLPSWGGHGSNDAAAALITWIRTSGGVVRVPLQSL